MSIPVLDPNYLLSKPNGNRVLVKDNADIYAALIKLIQSQTPVQMETEEYTLTGSGALTNPSAIVIMYNVFVAAQSPIVPISVNKKLSKIEFTAASSDNGNTWDLVIRSIPFENGNPLEGTPNAINSGNEGTEIYRVNVEVPLSAVGDPVKYSTFIDLPNLNLDDNSMIFAVATSGVTGAGSNPTNAFTGKLTITDQ